MTDKADKANKAKAGKAKTTQPKTDKPKTAPEAKSEQAQFSQEEVAGIREAFQRGRSVRCPRCGALMTARPLGGGSFGLGYARTREWLICAGCRRSALFDIRRGTRN